MNDVLIVDMADGSDAVQDLGDVLLTDGLETAVYLCLFGGDDWCLNALMPYEARHQSKTQKAFATVVLNSSGRLVIEQAVKEDLKLLAQQEGMDLTVLVQIHADRADIHIGLGGMKLVYAYSPNGAGVKLEKVTK